MGYLIHITRSPGYHFENQGHEIPVQEWLAYVERDAELRTGGHNEPCSVMWSEKGQWFDWDEGNIYTKNPDPPIIAKAIAIAEAFGARVQGDDGEVYLPDGKVERDGVIDDRPDMDWRQW